MGSGARFRVSTRPEEVYRNPSTVRRSGLTPVRVRSRFIYSGIRLEVDVSP